MLATFDCNSELKEVDLDLPPLPAAVLNIHYTCEDLSLGTLQNECPFPLACNKLSFCNITAAKYLTVGDDVKTVIECLIDVQEADIEYSPGDCIGIIPENSEEEIENIACLLNVKDVLHKSCYINLNKSNTKKKPILNHLPPVSTLYYILKTCVDIRTVPKKVLLRVLAEYTTDNCEKRCLQELSSRQGASRYDKWILQCGANVQDILNKFQTCKPPIERLLEMLPRLQPRYYSVASSPLSSAKLRIVFSVIEHPRKGVCSSWLYSLLAPSLNSHTVLEENSPNSVTKKVPLFLRKRTSFVLPEDISIPLILIGPGTGTAPFLGFLEHRYRQKSIRPNDKFGDIWLFFSCRYSERDFLYRSELEMYLQKGVLSHLFTSFSREDNNDIKYVQDNIKLHSELFLCQLLEKQSTLFVCGDANSMVKDVCDTIVKIIQDERGISEQEACSLVTELRKDGRYIQENWL